MAKIKKLTLDGATIYPATIMEAVKNRATNKTLAAELLSLVKAVNSGATTPDAALSALTALGTGYNSIVAVATTLKDFLTNATDSDTVINKWKEVEAFLSGITETQNLTGLLQQNLNSAKSYTDTEIDKIEKSIGNDKTSESEDGTVWGELKSLAGDISGHSVEIEALEEIKANYVTTDTEQTISARKVFSDGITLPNEGYISDIAVRLETISPKYKEKAGLHITDGYVTISADKEARIVYGDEEVYIVFPKKDGTVALVEDIPGVVTQSANGLMSAADKKKLDNIAAGANNYSLPAATASVLGGVKLGSDTAQSVAANAVSATASRTYAVQKNASGQLVVNVPWSDTNTTYNVATQSVNGLMSAADKKKLDAFGAATTYLTAAACNDVTDYPEITI